MREKVPPTVANMPDIASHIADMGANMPDIASHIADMGANMPAIEGSVSFVQDLLGQRPSKS